MGPPPRIGAGAGRHGPLDEAVDPLEVRPADQRADVGRLVARVALHQGARPARADALEELVGDAVLHQDPERAQADLAGVVELLDGQVHREVEVGVVEDQQRRLAAQLEGQRHDVVRRRRGDDPGGRHRAGEGEPADAGVRGERRARLRAGALDDVEHARRAARPRAVMSASSDAVSGAHSGGLSTTVFPAASAGPIRQVASISGAFHGVMIAATPAGS